LPFYDSSVDVRISQETLESRVRELGKEITRDYQGRSLTLVSVLKGSVMFLADLARSIDLPIRLDFLGLSSYGGETETTGVVRITSDLSRPIEHEDVLVVEDIIDTGLTMAFLLENLASRRPATVKICALLEKPSRARKKIDIHYKGFVIDDFFAVGYGLDYDERYRNLPFIGVLKNR
jgi:hypoxanthine phosphoribosyltransferase